MPSKFERLLGVVVSLAIILIPAILLWMDSSSGEGKTEMAFMFCLIYYSSVGSWALALLIGELFELCVWIIIRIVKKFQPKNWYLVSECSYLCFWCGKVAITCDCILILAWFTLGYQPWLMSVLMPILLLGVTCLVLAALLRSSMREIQ